VIRSINKIINERKDTGLLQVISERGHLAALYRSPGLSEKTSRKSVRQNPQAMLGILSPLRMNTALLFSVASCLLVVNGDMTITRYELAKILHQEDLDGRLLPE
jgi:hypothetical protein